MQSTCRLSGVKIQFANSGQENGGVMARRSRTPRPRAGRRQRLETVPAGVHRTAFCKQLGMVRLEGRSRPSASGIPVWMIDDASYDFFGRNNLYFVSPNLRSLGLAVDGTPQQESLIILWNGWRSHFSLTRCFSWIGGSPLGTARPKMSLSLVTCSELFPPG